MEEHAHHSREAAGPRAREAIDEANGLGERATAAIAMVFEVSLNPMLIADDDRYLVDANAAASLLLRTPREELLGRRIDDLVSSDPAVDAASLFAEFIASGTQSGPITLLLPDGTRMEVEYSAVANVQPGRHLSTFVVWPDQNGAAPAGFEPGQGQAAEGSDQAMALSPREREVLTLIAMGRSGEQIAAELFISPETVRSHVQNARKKLGAATRPQAVALAIAHRQIAVGLRSLPPSNPRGSRR